jgi:hypothetical protein
MALAISAASIDMTQKHLIMTCTIVASGNYTTGGDTLNFQTATFTPGIALPATVAPTFVEIKSLSTSGASGYDYEFKPGTTPANGLMQVFQAPSSGSNPLAEIPGSPTAYPAGVTGDTIICKAWFKKFA